MAARVDVRAFSGFAVQDAAEIPGGPLSQCKDREFCQMAGQACQGTGHCNPRTNCGGCNGDCVICGCDGNTYPDQQTACLAGTTAIFRGACGQSMETGGGGSGPGGELPVRVITPCATDAHCPDGEACCPRYNDAPPGTSRPCTSDEHCEAGQYCLGEGCSGPGGCMSFGSEGDCGVTLEPVCGCDGTTYTSAACASTRGVRIESDGMCAGE
jgi:hypothetical protein